MRTCTKCSLSKSEAHYYLNRPDCADCVKARVYAYRAANKEKCAKLVRQWVLKNPSKKKSSDKRWREANAERVAKNKLAWYKKNKDTIFQKMYARRKTDLHFKLRTSLRSRLNIAIKSGSKTGSAVRMLGCSIEEFKHHIESQFTPGMTWDNWSLKGWHLDHIVPLASFDLTNPEQLTKAMHFSNIRPLWSKENLRKGART